MKKWLALGATSVLLAIGVVGYRRLYHDPSNATINIAFNTWVGYGPLYIAQDKGIFAKNGLTVVLTRMEGTGERRSGLLAGRLHGVGSTVDDLVVTVGQGVPAQMVLAVDESNGADGILVSDVISSMKDLKGARIAVQPGFVNHFFLLYILKSEGMTSEDVTIVPMEPDAAAAAFAAKHIDAAVTWEPHLSTVESQRPDGKVLLRSGRTPEGDYSGIIVDILAFRRDFIRDHSDAVSAIVRSWYEALSFYESNAQEGTAIIADAMELEVDTAAEMLKGVRFLGQAENRLYMSRSQSPNAYDVARLAIDLWTREGIIATAPKVDEMIVATFVE